MMIKFRFSEGFGQDICGLVLGRNVPQIDFVFQDPFPDEVIMDLYMFCSCVKDRVCGNLERALIVAVDRDGVVVKLVGRLQGLRNYSEFM